MCTYPSVFAKYTQSGVGFLCTATWSNVSGFLNTAQRETDSLDFSRWYPSHLTKCIFWSLQTSEILRDMHSMDLKRSNSKKHKCSIAQNRSNVQRKTVRDFPEMNCTNIMGHIHGKYHSQVVVGICIAKKKSTFKCGKSMHNC